MKKSIINSLFWNYSLLILIFCLIFLVPFAPVPMHGRLYNIFTTLIYLTAAMAVSSERNLFLTLSVFAIPLDWISSIFDLGILSVVAKSFSIVFFILIVISFITKIAKSKDVTLPVILDSIIGFLLLSLVFSIILAITMRINPEAFSFENAESIKIGNIPNLYDYLYFTLVTMTTLGYGDLLPKTPYAKSIATLISVTGQFYVAILVALLVGKFSSKK